jgi:hypothetical protein
MSEQQYDGVSALDQNSMEVEPLRAGSSDGLREIERRGDFPVTVGPVGGEQQMVLSKYDADPQAGVAKFDDMQSGPKGGDTGMDALYDELDKYRKEQDPVNKVQTWRDTGKADLPADVSSTAKDRPDVSDS